MESGFVGTDNIGFGSRYPHGANWLGELLLGGIRDGGDFESGQTETGFGL